VLAQANAFFLAIGTWLCCVTAVLISVPAGADDQYSSFRIRQIASSQDGTAQLVELEEVGDRDGQDRLHSGGALALTVINRAGISRTFLFPSDLPSAETARRHVAIASGELPGVFLNEPFRPDFTLPREFLPTDGGTITFECSGFMEVCGIDSWSFDAIPTDGGLLKRNGETGRGTVQTFAGRLFYCCGGMLNSTVSSVGIDLTGVSVVEYYNASLDRYFNSGSQPDIDALDTGRISGWQRTESFERFGATSTPAGYAAGLPADIRALPVCRFFIPPGSHFLSASADECDAVAQAYPTFLLETRAAFYVVLPDLATGECPKNVGYNGFGVYFAPVYRLWNNRVDTNHRLTTSLTVRAEMITKGWISEGYGPMGVVMCGGPYLP
jgi:hypothetical protein